VSGRVRLAELVPGLGIVEGVITPHAEALGACRMHELRALMGGRVWRRIRTGEALVLCFRARAMLGQVVGGGL
jgi:hypothetical protein